MCSIFFFIIILMLNTCPSFRLFLTLSQRITAAHFFKEQLSLIFLCPWRLCITYHTRVLNISEHSRIDPIRIIFTKLSLLMQWRNQTLIYQQVIAEFLITLMTTLSFFKIRGLMPLLSFFIRTVLLENCVHVRSVSFESTRTGSLSELY